MIHHSSFFREIDWESVSFFLFLSLEMPSGDGTVDRRDGTAAWVTLFVLSLSLKGAILSGSKRASGKGELGMEGERNGWGSEIGTHKELEREKGESVDLCTLSETSLQW